MRADFLALASLAALTATGGTAGVDVTEFHGRGKILLMHSAALTGDTCDVKLQDSPDGTTWTDVPGAAFAQITAAAAGQQAIEVDIDKLQPRVRLYATMAGTAGFSVTLGASLVGKRQMPA